MKLVREMKPYGHISVQNVPCGYLHDDEFIPHGPNGWTGGVSVYEQSSLDAAVLAEREACAQVCESTSNLCEDAEVIAIAEEFASLIRARSDK